jgi:hypothetical protein
MHKNEGKATNARVECTTYNHKINFSSSSKVDRLTASN